MSLFSIRPGYAGSCRIISNTTNDAARICRSKKMRPSADSTYAKLPDRERFPSARARMQNQPCARLCPLVPLEVFAIGPLKVGGADGIRTHDLLDAIEARSQLRHGPTGSQLSNIIIGRLHASISSVPALPRPCSAERT